MKSSKSRFNPIKHALQEFFSMNKSERVGNIVLIIIILIGIVLYHTLPLFYKQEAVDVSAFKKEIAEFLASNQADTNNEKNKEVAIKEKYDTLKLFLFNPNTSTNEQLSQVGLSKRQIRILRNYLAKGGVFRTKNDFKKLYGISETQYNYLISFINLPDGKASQQKNFDYISNTDEKAESTPTYHTFNPNICTETELAELGFNAKQITHIRNYLAKGGKFKQKEDLRKIYGISNEQYTEIEQYIEIPTEVKNNKNEEVIIQKDLNTISANELNNIPGIGNYLAERIIKYKNMLGGYYSVNQLTEVYGINTELFNKISPHLKINSPLQRMININFAEISELKNHPYVGEEKAREIVNLRSKIGKIKDKSQLSKLPCFSNNSLEKLLPYIKF